MSAITAKRRGQPLLFLVVLLGGWLALRVAVWQPPFEVVPTLRALQDSALTRLRKGVAAVKPSLAAPAALSTQAKASERDSVPILEWPALARPLPAIIPREVPAGLPRAASDEGVQPSSRMDEQASAAPSGYSTARLAVGHALLTAMGLSQMQLPPALAALVDLGRRSIGRTSAAGLAERALASPESVAPPARLASASSGASRWSADAWLLARDDSVRASAPANQPSYGRSQAGAVLRYRLAPSSTHAPQAYVRASGALKAPHDAELAGGLSARPIGSLPVRLAAEVRVVDTQGGADVRPAAYAVTELPPFELPLGTRGEVYAQAGYVGGDFATGFVDGQARITRDLARLDRAGRSLLSAGAGAWGGAQKGAKRLDVGPSAAVSFSVGQVFSRLAVDYRVRVAGDAQPRSGPALTLSAGF